MDILYDILIIIGYSLILFITNECIIGYINEKLENYKSKKTKININSFIIHIPHKGPTRYEYGWDGFNGEVYLITVVLNIINYINALIVILITPFWIWLTDFHIMWVGSLYLVQTLIALVILIVICLINKYNKNVG